MRNISGLLLACAMMACAGTLEAASLKVGDPAPDFHATQFDGRKVSLADYRGQVLLINIWATWCAPCRKELPTLDAYVQAAGKWGLRMLAVTTEDSAPMSLLKKVQGVMTIPMARRFNGKKYDLVKNAVPTNFVIDRAGVVRYAAAGALDLDALNRILIPLLNEPAPANAAGASVTSAIR